MKKDVKRDVAVGFYTSKALNKKLVDEAKELGRSKSSHLSKILEERYEAKAK